MEFAKCVERHNLTGPAGRILSSLSAFDAAVLEFLRHGRHTLDHLDRVDAEGAMATRSAGFRGIAYLLLAKPELQPAITECLHCAESLGQESDPLAEVLVRGLRTGLERGRRAAAEELESASPAQVGILPFKLAYQLRFMTGDIQHMEASARRFLIQAPRDPHASFATGCLAFALEEQGRYDEARGLAEDALAVDTQDAWAAHVVSHVYEMAGQAEAGLEWSCAVRPHFAHCNNFRYHMEWHEGLFLIRLKRFSEALDHYDRRVRPEPTDDYRDFANASSYLARLHFHGVNVGERWDELLGLSLARAHEQELVFATLHRLLVFLCSHESAGVELVLEGLRELAAQESEQGIVARTVGLPVAEAMVQLDSGEVGTDLVGLARIIPHVGGSNAQREVFLEALIYLLGTSGRISTAAAIARVREETAFPPLLGINA